VGPGVTTVADSAAERLFPAVSPRTAGIVGRYVTGQQPTSPSPGARDRDTVSRLRAYSAAVLDVAEPLVAAEA